MLIVVASSGWRGEGGGSHKPYNVISIENKHKINRRSLPCAARQRVDGGAITIPGSQWQSGKFH